MTQLRMGRNGLPECPWEIREVVELYARENGRSATVHFVPGGGWFARLTLKPNDERMRLFQEGRTAEPPPEDVWFHEPNPLEGQIIPETHGRRHGPFRPLDILQMGPSGVREFLDKGNMWSGRGEGGSKTLEQLAKDALERSGELTRKFREEQRDLNRQERRAERRDRLNLPVFSPGIDLAATAAGSKPETGGST